MTRPTETLGARILIADDNPSVASLLEGILRSEGYSNITLTADPGEVTTLHRQHRYDLILLDVSLPPFDGFAVIDALKEIDPLDYLPVILMTEGSGHRLQALQAGVQAVIVKPFEIAEVRARVRNMLEVRLLRTANDECNAALATAEQALDLGRGEMPDSIVVGIDAAVRPLVSSYLRSRRDDVTRLTTALAGLDFHATATLSHDMVETGRSYGFDGLTQVARVIEGAAARGDAEAVRLGIVQVSRYLDRVRLVDDVE